MPRSARSQPLRCPVLVERITICWPVVLLVVLHVCLCHRRQPKDGNCLFHSTAWNSNGVFNNADDARARIVATAEAWDDRPLMYQMGSTSYLTSTDLVLAVSAKGASLEEWSDEMREDGAWGDIACIGIAPKMLNAYYLIYEKRGSEYAQVASVGSPTAQFLMRLELEGRCHYNVLLLKPGVHRHRPPPHPNPQPKPASTPAPAPKPAPKPTPPPAPKPAPKPAPSLPKPAAKPKPKAKPKPGGCAVVRGGARAKSIVDDVLGLDDSSYSALSDGRSDDEGSDSMIGDEDGKGSEAGRGEGSMDVIGVEIS